MVPNKKQALDGIKIVNFSWAGVGPLIVRYLALHGATVVRVESHKVPDVTRVMTPFKDGKPGIDRGPWFADLNSSVFSASLDLRNNKGMGLAWKLIEWADVLVENFSPGVMKRMGLDYEAVSSRNPGIVYLSSSQLGQTGPRSSFAAWGFQAAALAGFYHISGWPDRDPTLIPAYVDYVAPRFGALALLAALDYRRRTGKGQHLDQSQVESAVHFNVPPVIDYSVNGRILGRDGNRLPYAVPHGVYPCQGDDRWCSIAVFNDEEWHALCMATGNAAWVRDPRFATFRTRKKNETDLDLLIGDWTKNNSAEGVEELLQKAGVRASVVENSKDLMDDPQLKHRNYFRQIEHSVIGTHTYPGPTFSLSKTPDNQFAGPAMGQHNEFVLRDILKLPESEIADALQSGAFTTAKDVKEIKASF